MTGLHMALRLPVGFVSTAPDFGFDNSRNGFGRADVCKEFLEWLSSVGLFISERRWNRRFSCGPNKSFAKHADSLSPDLPRTKINIMQNAHDAEFIWYRLRAGSHLMYAGNVIRSYPDKVCEEIYRTSDMRPCLFNATEIHTLAVGDNNGKRWSCHSLNLVNEDGQNVDYNYAEKRLKEFSL